MSIQAPLKPRRRRRWFSFSLRTLLLLTAIAAAFLGVWVNRAERQRRAVAAIQDIGNAVGYDFEFDSEFNWIRADEPSGPGGLCKILGVDYCADAVFVSMEYIPTEAGLANLSSFGKLQKLELHYDRLADAELMHLSRLQSLRVLELYEEQITDAGLVHLSRLKNLQHLDVYATRVTDAGCDKLQQSLPNCKISRWMDDWDE